MKIKLAIAALIGVAAAVAIYAVAQIVVPVLEDEDEEDD